MNTHRFFAPAWALLACLGAGCSDSPPMTMEDAGPPPPPPSGNSVEEVLEALGVSTLQTPRVGADGEALPDSYSPLGARPYGFKLDELMLAGVVVAGGTETVSLFDGVPETRLGDGTVDEPFRFEQIALADTTWDSMSSVRVLTRGAVAADVDGDGRDELVVVHQRSDEQLYAVVNDDQEAGFARSEVMLSESALPPLSQIDLVAADVDGDGVVEIAAALTEPATADAPSSVTLWVLDPGTDGTLAIDDAWTTQIAATEDRGELSVGLAAGNLDDDNHEELALVVNELFRTTEGISRLHLFDSSPAGPGPVAPTSITVTVDLDPWRVKIGDCAIGDVNGDGRPELLLGGTVNINTSCDAAPDFVVGAFHMTETGLVAAIDSGVYLTAGLGCEDVGSVNVRAAFLNTLDADGDGDFEVAANHFIVDFDSALGEWTTMGSLAPTSFFPGETGAYTLHRGNTAVAVGDVTGDARDDLIYVTENATHVSVWGSFTNMEGSLEFGIVDRIPVDDLDDPVIAPINVDGDSYSLLYSPSESQLVFTEPVIVAALAGAPCYRAGQNSDACVTSFGQAETSGSEQEWSITLSASIILGLSSGVDVPFVKVEAETEHEISVALSYTGSHAYNLEKSVTYSTGPLEDTVVFTSVPYDMYTYRILDHPDPEQVGSRVAYFIPREPVTLQVERSFYNEHVVTDGVPVREAVFSHVLGDPSSYPTSAERDALMSSFGGIRSEAQAVGEGAGSTEVGLDVSEEWTNGGALEIGYQFTAKATAATAIAGYSIGISGSVSLSWTTGSSTSYHGTVGNLSAETFAENRYNFGLFTYPMSAAGREFQVLNYWVE